MITTTEMKMLTLLNDVIHGRKPDPVSEEEWPDLKKELYTQTVYAMPAENIQDLHLPDIEKAIYLGNIIKNRHVFHLLMKEQEQAFSILEAEGIPAVVMKGAAAAMYYPHPENRCMGDIDLLVQPQDFSRAYEVLVSAGYTAQQTLDDYERHIGLIGVNKIEIELHNYFSISDHAEQNALLDDMLYRAISSRQNIELCGYPVSVLPPLENGLIILEHINQHLSRGLGLRQIMDWMFYIENVVDDEFWYNTFAEKAEQIGLKRLAIIVTAMCKKYLGLEKNIHWCEYEPVCDELMEYILNRGNFGRKNKSTKSQITDVLKKLRNPIRGFCVAQSYGLKNWKAVKKHHYLRPFAWCYQLVHWVRLGAQGGTSVGLLNEAASSAKEEAEFLKKLGVTRL